MRYLPSPQMREICYLKIHFPSTSLQTNDPYHTMLSQEILTIFHFLKMSDLIGKLFAVEKNGHLRYPDAQRLDSVRNLLASDKGVVNVLYAENGAQPPVLDYVFKDGKK